MSRTSSADAVTGSENFDNYFENLNQSKICCTYGDRCVNGTLGGSEEL